VEAFDESGLVPTAFEAEDLAEVGQLPFVQCSAVSKGSGLGQKDGRKLKYAHADVLDGVLAIAILGVRKRKAPSHVLFLRQQLQLPVVVVAAAAIHIHTFVRDRWVGLYDVHVFIRCEPGNVGAKEPEVGYEASRDDEDDGGHASGDDDGG
jgi:hypothetical protein